MFQTPKLLNSKPFKNIIFNNFLNIFTFIFIFLFTLNIDVWAQANPLYIDQYPKQIKEDEVVYFTLKGEEYNLDSAKISWQIDGKTIDEGVGRVTFKYNAPKLNKKNKITATLERGGSDKVFVELILEATPYFLLFEGKDTFFPPFYKGRALPAKEGQVRAAIITNNSLERINWYINQKKISGDKQINIINTKLTDNKINIEAEILKNDNVVTSLNESFNLKQPEIYLFGKRENEQVYKAVLGSEKVKGAFSVISEIYYLTAINQKDSRIRSIWSINGTNQEVKDPFMINVTSNNKEQVQVKLEIKQIEKVTQSVQKAFDIVFE